MATWRLADWMVQLRPNNAGADHASWVFKAAEDQGVVGGLLRSAWLRSWLSSQEYYQWGVILDGWYQKNTNEMAWGERIIDTLMMEVDAWNISDNRAYFHPVWESLIKRMTQDKKDSSVWSKEQEDRIGVLQSKLELWVNKYPAQT